ncbi:CNT_collapsed_G0031380.mRNA.1.CDS.1 [Saccharomyces cerevisiae]|nr:CNT_collapsed_G0031380.mRNA.1.CDS.1 [Saccharomyces cerevisiae]
MSCDFLIFRLYLTKLNIFLSMVLTFTSAMREYSKIRVSRQALSKIAFELCVCWAGQKPLDGVMCMGSSAVERHAAK